MTPRRSAQHGFTLPEILVSMFLLTLVALANSALIRSLGLLGNSQFSTSRYERPARMRTLAMEYVQAEMEFLRNHDYREFRDASACNPPGSPAPIASARRVPAPGPYLTSEPQLPPPFSAADILLSDEPVVNPQSPPNDCRPRRVTVLVYYLPGDVPVTIGDPSGTVFLRGETVKAIR